MPSHGDSILIPSQGDAISSQLNMRDDAANVDERLAAWCAVAVSGNRR